MDFLDMIDELLMEVPSALEPTALRQLSRASREFCRDTRIWQRRFDIYTVNGIPEYELDAVDQGAVIEIEWMALNGCRLDGRHSQAIIPLTSDTAKRGVPQTYHYFAGSAIYLEPVPDKQYIIVGVQSLQPERNSTEIPDWLGETWGETIIQLAAAKLLMMPNKPWTDPQAAGPYLAEYNKRMMKAKQQAAGEDQPATRIVQYGGL